VTNPRSDGIGATTEPAKIDVDRSEGVTLTWRDGTAVTFDLVDLRVNCPCAECRERRKADRTVWPRPGSPQPLRILDARLVGAFGIGFEWNDGHGTGIYTWDALRRWSEERGAH
jgi:ATP-binding protein involved in chromosome partitioning